MPRNKYKQADWRAASRYWRVKQSCQTYIKNTEASSWYTNLFRR
jgi:hypothetical protein